MTRFPLIVGIGGTAAPGSSTETALSIALVAAEAGGARTRMFDGAALAAMTHYAGPASITDVAADLIDSVRAADGLIIASPGYHGSISGLVKNAIDHLEETARDERVYLDGVPVGLIATAYGWQASGTTLAALRAIVHALRGWPTPLGAGLNCSNGLFRDGMCADPSVAECLVMVGRQVLDFAQLQQSRKAGVAA